MTALVNPLLLVAVLATADASPTVAWHPYTETSQSVRAAPENGPITAAVVISGGLFRLYQRGAAPSKGQSCPMAPSCSEFGRIAVRDHGLLVGILLTADRLHRCGHDLQHYEPVWLPQGQRSYDPVPPR